MRTKKAIKTSKKTAKSENHAVIITGSNNRRLQYENGIVSFSMKINQKTNYVTIIFSDTGEKQEFGSFESYIYELSYYYRRRLEALDTIDEKLGLCNKFLNTLFMYMTDYGLYAKDKENFNKNIHLYIEQFEYFKKQYLENKQITTVEKKDFSLSTNEKIIILDYLGILKIINEAVGNNQTNAVELLSKLLDRNPDNLKKTASRIIINPKEKGAVKTVKTLNTVLDLAKTIHCSELERQAKSDLDKINKK